jgi:hypothetical protein
MLGTISAVSMFRLIEYITVNILNTKLETYQNIILLSASFFYILSTYVVEHIVHPTIVYGFYLAPLILLTLMKGINESKKNYAIYTAILWSLAVSDAHWIVYGSIIISGYIIYHFFWYIFKSRNKIYFHIYYLLIVFILFILLNFYWILPGSLSGGTSLYGNILTRESISNVLFRHADISNAFAMRVNFNLEKCYGNLPPLLGFFEGFNLNICLLILTIFGLSIFIFHIKEKNILFFGILFVISIFLSSGPRFAPKLFNWLMFDLPIHTIYAWAFRTPKFHQFIILALAPLIALTGLKISENINKLNKVFIKFILPYLFIILIIIFSLIPNYPLITGDFNGNLDVVDIPEDFKLAISYLSEKKGDYKIIWGPPYPYVSFKTSWHSKPIGDLTNDITPKPTLSNPRFENNLNLPLLFGFFAFDSLAYSKQMNNLEKFYTPLSVRYIVVHDDIPAIKPATKSLINVLNNQEGLKKIGNFGFITIYKVYNTSDQITIKQRSILIQGGLLKYSSLSNIVYFIPIKFGVVYYDDSIWTSKYIQEYTSMILVSNRVSEIIISSSLNESIILRPFEETDHYYPLKFWSKTTVNSIDFRRIVNRLELEDPYQLDYGYGIVFTRAKNTTLTTPFKLDKTDKYKLFIRYFENQKGGEIKVYIDSRPIEINTENQFNKFVWKELGTFYLEKREHEIVLENVKGFNAVNLFVLIPEKEYYKAKEEVKKLLENKTVIYLFEAESDLYRSNAKITRNINASNGELIALNKNSKAWQDIEIIKNGTYKLVLRGIGSFEISIGDRTFNLTPYSLNFTYTPMFYLERGTYRLEIKPLSDNAKLDVLWLYSTETNQTIDQLFEVKENLAEVVSYTKINPTLWKVKVNATKPFMLSFAEAYDPLWEARVYKDGKKVEAVKSIPLYSVINGFWINETGNLEIVIRYKPQDWFEIGLVVSTTTFVGCISYLFYDWRREKGDKWALKVEMKIRRTVRRK